MYEEILTYNKILKYITKNKEQDEDQAIIWKFKHIASHQGLLKKGDPGYNRSKFNVLVEWETGESTYEPLDVIAANDPVTCAIYAKEKGLLNEPGWPCFKLIAKRESCLLRMTKQGKLRSFSCSWKYKFGYQVPNNYAEAMLLDKKNLNSKWADAEEKERACFREYQVFKDIGKNGRPPAGYKPLKILTVHDVKHDGRHRACMVAAGHLTEVPVKSVYSGVISLRGIRLMIFLVELNQMEAWGTDISSAYLKGFTKEKLFVKAGPEFGDQEGHILLVKKALYRLRTSGVRWHERLADCLCGMGFFPCKAEPNIWMREKTDHWEYIGTYVDDLAIASKDPQAIVDKLVKEYKFKLKGTGPISYHLGCDFMRDKDKVLCIQPRKYIEWMVDTYVRLFGEKLKELYSSPLKKGDHPELNTSDLLDTDGIQKSQSMIGAMQWAISIGRFDIATAFMVLSSFCVAPRVRHLEHCKRIYAYRSKMQHAVIRG